MATATEKVTTEKEKPAVPAEKAAPKKIKAKRSVSEAIVHIFASFNNINITFTDTDGNVLCWSTAGENGFKGSRKSTPHAATVTAERVCERALEYGVKSAEVLVMGPGPGRESAIRALGTKGIKVTLMRDITPFPHNGGKPPKTRRV